jgi:hypothetical protein
MLAKIVEQMIGYNDPLATVADPHHMWFRRFAR